MCPSGSRPFALDKSLLHWINDGLMAIFFFLVGLEIKRELVVGELSTAQAGGAAGHRRARRHDRAGADLRRASTGATPVALRGWAIPGRHRHRLRRRRAGAAGRSRIPPPLKIFLLALAIIDDLGAIIIIAFFYTSHAVVRRARAWPASASPPWSLLNRRGVTAHLALRADRHLHLGVRHGIGRARHAGRRRHRARRTARRRRRDIRRARWSGWSWRIGPWVRFGVLPLFAFANAGVSLAGITLAHVTSADPHGHRARSSHRQADRHLRLLVRRHPHAARRHRRKARRGRRSSASPSSAASASP